MSKCENDLHSKEINSNSLHSFYTKIYELSGGGGDFSSSIFFLHCKLLFLSDRSEIKKAPGDYFLIWLNNVKFGHFSTVFFFVSKFHSLLSKVFFCFLRVFVTTIYGVFFSLDLNICWYEVFFSVRPKDWRVLMIINNSKWAGMWKNF